jgi:hypothetical protein
MLGAPCLADPLHGPAAVNRLANRSGARRVLLLPGQQGLLSLCCDLRCCVAVCANDAAAVAAAICGSSATRFAARQ